MRHRTQLALALPPIVILAFTFIGCTMAKISGRGEKPLILNQPQAKVDVVQKFEHSKQLVFDYTSAFDVSEILDEVLIGSDADAIINLTITVKTTVGDFFLNLITLGLAQAKTFQVSGTAVKAPEGLGFLMEPGTEMVMESDDLKPLATALLTMPEEDQAMCGILKFHEGYRLVKLY